MILQKTKTIFSNKLILALATCVFIVVSTALLVIGFRAYEKYQLGDHKLTDADLTFLSDRTIDKSLIKEEESKFSFIPDATEEDPILVTKISGSLDADDQAQYSVDISKNPDDGIIFSDAEGDRSVTLKPLHRLGDARLDERGRVVYPKSRNEKHVISLKNSGIKEDIILTQASDDALSYSWELVFDTATLESKLLPDGSLGFFSANPYLYGNITVSDDKSQELIDNAKKTDKSHLIFKVPKPFILDAENFKNYDDVSFSLDGNILTLNAKKMLEKKYPLSIDPTIVITTTAEFRTGSDNGMISYATDGQLDRLGVKNGETSDYTTEDYFDLPRANHASVAYNGYLYVVGGILNSGTTSCKTSGSDNYCSDVQYAPINSDGTIGSWTRDPDTVSYFNSPRRRHAVAAYNGYMYLSGGSTSAAQLSDVQYVPINSDGSVGDWNATTSFTDKRENHTMVMYKGYMYISGGDYGTSVTNCKDAGTNAFCNDTQYAPINADGTLGSFTKDTSSYFSFPRSSHTALAYNDYYYIIAGEVPANVTTCKIAGNHTRCSDIQFAPINADGSLGTFTTNSEYLLIPREGHAAAFYGGYMFTIGGQIPSNNTTCKDTGVASTNCNDTEYAQVYADGTVGEWTQGAEFFDEPRQNLSFAYYNDKFYVMGGVKDVANTLCKNTGTSTVYCNDTQLAVSLDGVGGIIGDAGTWTLDSPRDITTERASHALVAYNGYMYIMGGVTISTSACKNAGTSIYCNDVWYAPINLNGTLGAWTQDTSSYFSEARAGHEGFAYNGRMYIVGGSKATSNTACKDAGTSVYCNDVQYATINANGSLGTWTTNATYFEWPRNNHASFAYNGYMYVLGGQRAADTDCKDAGSDAYCNDYQYAAINANGSVGIFTTDTSSYFATPRAQLGAVAYNGYIYVTGGNVTSTTACKDTGTSGACNDVQYAVLFANGRAGAFVTSSSYFTTPRWGHATYVYNDSLYISGGKLSSASTACKSPAVSSSTCNDTQYATVNLTTVGTFTATVDYFDFPRTNGGGLAYNGRLYMIGGELDAAATSCKDANNNIYCSDVWYTLTAVITPALVGRYERIVDTTIATGNVLEAITINGDAACTEYLLEYRTAGSDFIFDATVAVFVQPGVEVPINIVNERYVWFSISMDDTSCGLQSNVTDVVIRTNAPPAAPILLLPRDTSTGVAVLPEFRLGSTDDSDDYIQYVIEVCSTSNCSVVVRTINQTSSQTGWLSQSQQTATAFDSLADAVSQYAIHKYQPAALSASTQYWWRAYGIDPGGTNTAGPYSTISTFTTGVTFPDNLNLRGGTTIRGGTNLN